MTSNQPVQFKTSSTKVPTTFGTAHRDAFPTKRSEDLPGSWDFSAPVVPATHREGRRKVTKRRSKSRKARPASAPLTRIMSTQPLTFRAER